MILEKNMKYKIIFMSEKIISKDISKIPKNNLDLIFKKLDSLWSKGVLFANTKKLNNYKVCDYRLRVWDFRILFNLDEIKKEIVIFRILHRSKLY